MNRRNLFGAVLALIAAIGLVGCKEDKPATQQAAAKPAEAIHWKMVTSWPKNFPGLGTAAERLAERINAMSAGRLTVKVYAAGELVPALEVFAHVQSLPEPGLAIIALGKRDIGCDPDLPMPQRWYAEGKPPQDVLDWTVRHLMDQHLYLNVPAGTDLAVGDILSFGTSHPCLTFDKWRSALLVDEQLQVIESMHTCF